MTVLSYQQITGLAPAPLAPSSSSPSSGSNIGSYAGTDWSYNSDERKAALGKQRRAAIAKAAKTVEDRPAQTKSQRLANAQYKTGADRDTGSNAERRATHSSVAKAAASLANEASDSMFSDPDFRAARAALRQRYPHGKLSDMCELAAALTERLNEDPAAAFLEIQGAYSRLPLQRGKPVEFAKGLRGSLQRAQVDQADAADLADWAQRYGKRLPDVIKELAALDAALSSNTVFEAAKLAARYGAPANDSEVPEYEVHMAAKQAQKAHAAQAKQDFDARCKGVQMAIERGLIPGDEPTLNEIAEILLHKYGTFQHTTDKLGDLQRAAAIAKHPDHRARKVEVARRERAGQKSISGAPGTGQGARDVRGKGGVRDSIARVRGAM